MKDMPKHRHFSMSEGTYQMLGELQFFRKLSGPIIFWGLSSAISYPLKDSDYGFKSPLRLDVSLTFLTKKMNLINAALGIYAQYKYSGESEWNDIPAPNSKGSIFTPGFGLIWSTNNKLGIQLNCLFPNLLTGDLAGIESTTKQDLTAMQISLGLRKTFDYSIPFLE